MCLELCKAKEKRECRRHQSCSLACIWDVTMHPAVHCDGMGSEHLWDPNGSEESWEPPQYSLNIQGSHSEEDIN